MAKKRKIILSVVSLIVALFIGWSFVSSREPSYDGRSLSEWADMGLKATDQWPWNTNDVLVASNAIRQIGRKAVPLAYAWGGKLPSWGLIDGQLNELSGQIGWMERFPNGDDRYGYGSFLLRPFERGRFIAYAMQEDMVSGSTNSFRLGRPSPEWVLNSFNDRTLLLALEQLPPNAAAEVATAVLHEIGAEGRDESVFGPALWAFSEATTNREAHFLSLTRMARTGFRPEEIAANLAVVPRSTNPDDSVSYRQILAAFRKLGPVGWPYLARSLTNELPLVRQKAFEELALDYDTGHRSLPWMPLFRLVSYSKIGLPIGVPSTNRLEFVASQSEELSRAFVEQASEFYPSRPRDFSAWDRTNAVVILSRFTNDPSPPIAARSLEALRKINALPPAQ